VTQSDIEAGWIARAREMMRHDSTSCGCPYDTRLPGFLGARYAERKVMLVGAIHNFTVLQTDLASESFLRYSNDLKELSRAGVAPVGMLQSMREAYAIAIARWSGQGVWKIFDEIRSTLGLRWEQVVFTNLAACSRSNMWPDLLVECCQDAFPLADLVNAIDAELIFIAKDNASTRQLVVIPGEGATRKVIRYSNAWSGMRNGRSWSEWVPELAEELDSFVKRWTTERK
jgi:hypothetical protein